MQQDKINCVMTDFHEWFNAYWPQDPGTGNFTVNSSTPVRNVSLFEMGARNTSEVEDLFKSFATGQVEHSSRTYVNQIGIIDEALKFIVIDFPLNLEFRGPPEMARPVLALLSNLADEINRGEGTDALPVTFANQDNVWIVLQEVLVRSLFRGLLISFPFAFVILLFSSFNFVLALYATVTIACICVSSLGFTHTMGWTLGSGEVILAILIIGLSVDYVIHLSHIYKVADAVGLRWREEKVEFMVYVMADTLIAAWLTTTSSALVLLFAISGFFAKMALLITVAMTFSMLYCFAFFVPLCFFLGPEFSFGQMPLCWFEDSCPPVFRTTWGSRKGSRQILEELSLWQLESDENMEKQTN